MWNFLIMYIVSLGFTYGISVKICSILITNLYKDGYKLNLKKMKKETNLIQEISNDSFVKNFDTKILFYIPIINVLFVIYVGMLLSDENTLANIYNSSFIERISKEEHMNLGDNPTFMRIFQETVQLKIKIVKVKTKIDNSYIAYYESKEDYMNGSFMDIIYVNGEIGNCNLYDVRDILLSGECEEVRSIFFSEEMDKKVVIDKIRNIVNRDRYEDIKIYEDLEQESILAEFYKKELTKN